MHQGWFVRYAVAILSHPFTYLNRSLYGSMHIDDSAKAGDFISLRIYWSFDGKKMKSSLTGISDCLRRPRVLSVTAETKYDL